LSHIGIDKAIRASAFGGLDDECLPC